MRYDGNVLVLSRRNLLALLHKLDMPGSKRTIVKCLPVQGKTTLVEIRAEEDQGHYEELGHTPGKMHPLTEKYIKEHPAHAPLNLAANSFKD